MNEFTISIASKINDNQISVNICSEIDFETVPYEVTLQDIMYTPGAWDNVREGANIVSL
jgi:hypothetical protein